MKPIIFLMALAIGVILWIANYNYERNLMP